MFHSSRTTLRELKKRYLNILKKCLLLNMGMILISTSAISGTATDANSLMAELEKNERTLVTSGTHVLTYDETNSLYDAESNSIIFPSVETSQSGLLSGGRLYNKGDISFNSNLKLIFQGNDMNSSTSHVLGSVIHNLGTMTFNTEVSFSGNVGKAKLYDRGVVYNKGSINFNNHVSFKDNLAAGIGWNYVDSVAVYNEGGTINFTSADFIGNQSGTEENLTGRTIAINNVSSGQITFSGCVNFKDNKAINSGGIEGATIWNAGGSKITFLDKAIFLNNQGYTYNGQSYGGALTNGQIGKVSEAKIEFADVDFIGNKAIGASDGIGGAINNRETIIFNGAVLFQENESEGQTGYSQAGGINNIGSVVFNNDVRFIGNKAKALKGVGAGGALYNTGSGEITFKEKAVFLDNIAEGVTAARGGAIESKSVLTFENGFYFEGNKTILNQTLADGTISRTEKYEDIYMRNMTSSLNITGTDTSAIEFIGGGISGDEDMGTINKSSVATLVFGEESDSSGYTGIFNQTAGKTVAKSETFLGGTNNILGGELETHGSEILYTAVVGQNKDETTGEVLSSGTLTHLALGSEPVEIKGLSFKEEGTNLSMTFKNGTSERAHYQLNEDIMNATGNKLAFENSELALADNIKVSGTIEAKNSDIDVGTREISVDEITLKEDATLKMIVNSLTEHGKVNGVITGVDTSKIALQLGVDLEKGIYQLFDRDNEVKTVVNAIFNVKDLEDGSFEISKKTAEELSSSLDVGENEGKALSSMMMRSAPNKAFTIVQEEVLEALQSEDESKQKKAKESLTALGGRNTSLYQSQATAGFTQLHNVVSQMLMNTAAPVFGHAGGEEPARASIYIKGLYDRVNSLTGDGFRMRSKGAVLGVQSAVTEDLTVGVGYAGVDTTAKEPLRRTEVKTNTGFISAQYQPNDWWVSGVVTYSRSQYDEEKQVLSSTGKANYDVDSLGAQITTGYNIKKGKMIVTPEVGIRYLNAKQEGYKDSLGTTVEATNSDFVTAMAGFKVGADLGWVRPLAGVMVGYDVITDDISSVNTLANGATYTIKGEALDRLSTTVVAGFGMDIGHNATLKIEYNGNYRKEYLDHSGMLRLEAKF